MNSPADRHGADRNAPLPVGVGGVRRRGGEAGRVGQSQGHLVPRVRALRLAAGPCASLCVLCVKIPGFFRTPIMVASRCMGPAVTRRLERSQLAAGLVGSVCDRGWLIYHRGRGEAEAAEKILLIRAGGLVRR